MSAGVIASVEETTITTREKRKDLRFLLHRMKWNTVNIQFEFAKNANSAPTIKP